MANHREMKDKKLDIHKKKDDREYDTLGKSLDRIYNNILTRAQNAHDKFQVTKEEKERENEKENQTEKEDKMCSLDNLLCYLALRDYDLSDLQQKLAEKGLAFLVMSESHILLSIEQILKRLGINPANTSSKLCKINSQSARSILTKRSELLFGLSSEGRRTHIMVTLDSSDIFQYELMENLLESGMDIVRINCAHKTAKEWELLIETLRTAEEQLSRKGRRAEGDRCMILMDLGGPKIRTGPMQLKVRPLQISSPKDVHGRLLRLAEGFLDSEADETKEVLSQERAPQSGFVISISRTNYGGLGSLEVGQKITFKDTRDGSPRSITVLERISPTRVRVGLEHTALLNEGMTLECQPSDSDGESKCSFTVGALKPQPIEINVEARNILRLYRDMRLGYVGDPAGFSCTHPDILNQVKVGHRVFIDDGRIEAIVKSSNEEYLELEVVSPQGTTAKIKSNKGMNFPDSGIKMPALTSEDIRNLDFITKHADMVGLSFVHGPQDIYDLREALSKLGRTGMGVIAKIETSDSIHNLARTVIAGLGLPKFAVLIARGDLAVEVGFENLVFIQEDILCICEAAHIPVIMATQILESLAESGLRSRPEIADAIMMGRRAECVMLNNGLNIIEAVRTMARLLSTKEERYHLKYQLFGEFTEQYGIFDSQTRSMFN